MGLVEEHIWKPPVLIPSEKEESCEVMELGKRSSCWGCAFPHTGSGLPAEPGTGPASEHPSCFSGSGLLGRGWDTQVQLDLESVCV